MIEKVRKTIDKYQLIGADEHIVLGLSGGPDSVCLFHVLKSLGYHVHAVHVNHMIRETAERDQVFVEKLCAASGAECTVRKEDCKKLAKELKVSEEEAGRKARYEAFRQAADDLKAYGIDAKIAVAHNADDQAETLLFRILRGTGTDGLAGMEHKRRDGDYEVIRPLLDVTRVEIERYCEENGVEYVTDETNEMPLYARNRIRLELLPMIREQYNESVGGALCRLAAIAGEDKDYLWQQAEETYAQAVIPNGSMDDRSDAGQGQIAFDHIVFDRNLLAAAHPAIGKRVVMKALRELGLWEDVSYERLSAVAEQIGGSTSTKVIEFPHGYSVTIAFDKVKVKSPVKVPGEHQGSDGSRSGIAELSVESKLSTGREAEDILQQIRDTGYPEGQLVFDADLAAKASGITKEELPDKVCARARESGDFMPTKAGTKKLKKLLGEMKIPADERAGTPLIAAGRCVLAVRSVTGGTTRYADALRVNNETNAILTVKFV